MLLLTSCKILCHSRDWFSADPLLEALPGLSSLLNVGKWAVESPIVAVNTWMPNPFCPASGTGVLGCAANHDCY